LIYNRGFEREIEMRLFKRKPKCQRKNGKHIIDFSLHCIYCGKNIVEFDEESYKKNRREISKKLYHSIKRHKNGQIEN